MKNIARPTSKLHKAAIKRNKIWNWAVLLLVLMAVTSLGLAACSTAPTATIEVPNTVASEISVDEAYQKYVDGVFFLDVRTPEEWNDYHAPDTTLIPLNELENRLDELSKNDELLAYCRTGRRSSNAMNILQANGFTKIFHMNDGITGWIQAGYPTL